MKHHAVWFTPPAFRAAEGLETLYAVFEKAWLAELNPQSALELEAAHDFIRSAWRKREVIEAQNRLGASFTDDAAARKLDRLLRHEREFEMRCERALRRLTRHRAEREAAAWELEPAATSSATELAQDLADALRDPETQQAKTQAQPLPAATLPSHDTGPEAATRESPEPHAP